jgi:L-alanine-DL-glutamate epimerase-like enolase superfamily enzyme
MNRKDFLKKTALGAGALPILGGLALPSFASIPDKPAQVLPPIKITAVKAYAMKKALYVKVETDAGVSGWGEGSHDNIALTAQAVEEFIAPKVKGKDPFQSEYLWNWLYYSEEDIGQSGLWPGAIAGFDNALWDLKGKLLGLPVHKLLGGSGTEKVKVYGSFARGEGKKILSDLELAKQAEAFILQGIDTLKLRMQIRLLQVDPEPDPTFETIKQLRKAIGDNITLFVDFNNGYRASKAIAMANKLYEYCNIAAVEEPVSYQTYDDLAQVVAAVDIPVMAGEHEYNRWQFRDLITRGKVDVLNADLIKAGGLSECLKIAHMASAFDRPIMVHNARPTYCTATSLQLIAAISNAARVQEYTGKRAELDLGDLFHNNIVFTNGYLEVPQIPGMGLLPNEQAMEKNKLNK